MHVESLDVRQLTETDAQAIAELLVSVWRKPGKNVEYRRRQMKSLGDSYDGPDKLAPRSFIIRESARIIAHATFLSRMITTSTGPLRIAGLARVCTDPNFRGQKLGEKVVRAVFELVDKKLFPYALFQTTPEVQPFYEKMGACIVKNPIINSMNGDLHVSPFWDKVIMRYPQDGDWPQGVVDLCGPGY